MSAPLTILVTASGAPGSPRLLRALRENGERDVRLVGVDMREESAGRFLCDAFHRVPAGSAPGYLERLLEVAAAERVDVVFPQSSAEVGAIAAGRDRFGVPVLVSPPNAIERASAKSETVRVAEELGIPQPRTIHAADADRFREAAAELGYPGRDVCMKPLEAKGSRGFRVLSATADRRDQLVNGRPGTLLPISLDEAAEILDGGEGFPPVLVMELVEGDELAVDILCREGRTLVASTKTREAFRAGLAMEFRIVDRPHLVRHARRLVEALELDWIVNVQFLGDRLLEVNPRISTLIYQPDLNLPWLAVRLALGELDEQQVAEHDARTEPGRRVTRYYEQVEYAARPTTGSDR
ncbi:MAG TPA: ATP-grasp domain-containing protein [Gaiellales bacterium]